MIDVRDNWRILLLLVLTFLAGLALFGPLGASGQDIVAGNDDATDLETGIEEAAYPDPTNLQYGLELSGGARIRGQLVGMTAENVEIERDAVSQIETDVSNELGVDAIDVRVRADRNTVELFDNRTEAEFAAALNQAGLDVSEDDIRTGVTAPTRDEAVETLTERLDRTGLSGVDVGTRRSPTGGSFIVAEAPGISLQQLRAIASEAGRVQVIAGYPVQTENGTELVTEPLLSSDDFSSIDNAEPATADRPAPQVPVLLTREAGEQFRNRMVETGFTSEGIDTCFFDPDEHDGPQEGQYCLYTVVDGEYVYGASMSSNLANTLEHSGEDFLNRPAFVMRTGTFADAQALEINLRAGALPTDLDIQSETFISPSLAQLFKPLALLTALLAWMTVSAVVYVWYRDVRVAIPMLVTASTEVFLLLGFAAAVGMALDLSHIAGLIAVIGTGLDDLIIMADEILQRQKEVKTGRIFQNRFRKAFWVIGMAAATTIVAMSPLAVMSLGDLQGFAIITIIGVIIGVGITRPAYGDILRHLMLDDVKRK